MEKGWKNERDKGAKGMRCAQPACHVYYQWLLLVLLALIVSRVEKEDAVAQVGVIVIYVLSCGIGGFVLGKWKKRQKFLWGLLVGILYVATLLGAALWIQKGSLPPIPYMGTASAICIGSAMLGGMLS